MLLKIFRWFCGSLLVLIGGLALAKVSATSGLSLLAAGLLVLPPTFPLLARATGYPLSRPAKFLATLVCTLTGVATLATGLEPSPQHTPQEFAALRLARHVEDSLAVAEGPLPGTPTDNSLARPVPPRNYGPARYRRSQLSRRYYPNRYYRAPPAYSQPAAPAAARASSPRTYTYSRGTNGASSSPPARSSPAAAANAPAARQSYQAPRVYSYRPGRQPAAAPPSRPQSYKPTRFSWKRSSK